MAIIKSAKKAIRQSARRRVFNIRRKDTLKTTLKSFGKLIEAKQVKEATAMLPALYQAVDKAVKGKIIEKNTGARRKSRASGMLKAAQGK